MKKCTYCRHENTPAAKFCNYCGTSFEGYCAHCSTQNPPHAKFCLECGTVLKPVLAASGATRQEEAVTGGESKSIRAAERRQLTILFCDLVGSTALSEKLDPEDYRQIILGYQEVAEKVIREYSGHVAQYLGDGLLVYFGYPQGLEDAPKSSVQAGLGILEAVRQANQQYAADGKTTIEIRIGIHTGLVIVDDHLALGAATNIADRLQNLAPNNSLVISPQTLKLSQGWFEVQSLGMHHLKGISAPMEVFQVLRESNARTRLEVAKRRGLSPLVGRRGELASLQGKWKLAKSGKGNLVLLSGEAGIGKSRMADTLEQQVFEEGEGYLLHIHCSAYHLHSAFYPILEFLENEVLHFEREESPEDKVKKLEQFLQQAGMDVPGATPLFAEFLSIASADYPSLEISTHARRQRIMESFQGILLHYAARHPVLLVLEDLHWADASTLECLRQFMEHLSSQPVLMLCTSRPGFQADWLHRPFVTTIPLQRLSQQRVAEICRFQAKGRTLPEEILERIYSKTEGVPLFVEELMKMVLESGMLQETEGGYELTGDAPALAIPSTLQDSLLARLDQLSAVKEVVQLGSVLGREFSFELLNAILEPREKALKNALDQLLEAEIIYRKGAGDKPVYKFKHALIRDAAYESMLKHNRQKLHREVASVLEWQFSELSQSQPELLAYHYAEAGLLQKSIPFWLQAGLLASRRHANEEAIIHLEKGMELLAKVKEGNPVKSLELDFLLTLGGAMIVYYGYTHPRVEATFNRAKELSQTVEVNAKLAFILYNLQTFYLLSEKAGELNELIDYALEIGSNQEEGYLFRLFAQHNRGAFGIESGDFAMANRILKEAVDLYNPYIDIPLEFTPGGNVRINASSWWSVSLQISGFMDQARKISDRHLTLVKEFKDSRTLYHIYGWAAWRGLEAREWKATEKLMEKYMPIASDFGDPFFMMVSETYYQIALAFQGDRPALDRAVQLVDTFLEMGTTLAFVVSSSFIAELYYRFEEYESALTLIERACAHVNRSGSHLHTAEFYRIKGLTLEALGASSSEVEQNYLKAIDLARNQSAKTFELRAACDLARWWRQQNKTEAARRMLEGSYHWFREGFESADMKSAAALLKELQVGAPESRAL